MQCICSNVESNVGNVMRRKRWVRGKRAKNENIQKVSPKINSNFQVRGKQPPIFCLYLSAYPKNQPLSPYSTFIAFLIAICYS